MISYYVKHHISGRIRIEVPLLRNMTLSALKKLADKIDRESHPQGIKDISANPLTASIIIKYDADVLDIMAYLNQLVTNKEIQNIVGQGNEDKPCEKKRMNAMAG